MSILSLSTQNSLSPYKNAVKKIAALVPHIRLSFADEDEQVVRRRKPPKLPSDATTPLSWLKSVVSEIDLGKKVYSKKRDTEHPIHLNENEDVKAHFGRLASFNLSWLPNRWTKSVLEEHCSGAETYFFAGAGDSSKPYTLVMIDVDCKQRGTPEGARAFLEHLRDRQFPNLYIEVSTNGRGGHGYFLLDKEGMGTEGIKPILTRQLAPWLNEQAEGFDVEFVEVKGLPPEITWGDQRFELRSYKSGVLAKVPRGMFDRFEELRRTTVVKASHLRKLKLFEKPVVAKNQRQAAAMGSITGRHFGEEQLSALKDGGRYHRIASELLSDRDVRTSGRQQVTVEDVAIFLMVGDFFTKNMNPNGTMPTRRWASMWKALFGEGDVVRAWDHKRFAAIRNLLSSLGLIAWTDASYSLGYKRGDVQVKGCAAKWQFSEELMAKLAEAEEVASSGVNGGKEKHPLWEQSLRTWASELIQTPETETIRPHLVETIPLYRYSPDEINNVMTQMTALAA